TKRTCNDQTGLNLSTKSDELISKYNQMSISDHYNNEKSGFPKNINQLYNMNGTDLSILSSDSQLSTISHQHMLENTYVFPYVQYQEELFIQKIFESNFDEIFISTAYMNLPNSYINHMKNRKCTIIAPDATCNTFCGKKIFNRIVVSIYDFFQLDTYQKLPLADLRTFHSEKISFHFKGIWGFNQDFAISVIGSSNFNERSFRKDKELCFLLVTRDVSLIRQFRSEVDFLLANSEPYIVKKTVNLFIWLIAFIFKHFL
ncbi:Phosphatidylglycerolphosphate synthase, partial [Pseudoloma neurophilia]